MVQRSLSRRRFGAALTALTTVAIAGCSDDETTDETDDETGGDDEAAADESDTGEDDTFELDNPGDLTIILENEDGEPVSSGVAVSIESAEEDFTANYQNEIQDGEISGASLIYEGEYTVTAESLEGEFDTVEETASLEEDEDEELTLVLEGATGDEAE